MFLGENKFHTYTHSLPVSVILLNLYLTAVHLYSYMCHINLATLINELEFIATICPAYERVSINYTIK